MSTHNICFHGEIRKVLCGHPLLSVAMTSSLVKINLHLLKLAGNEKGNGHLCGYSHYFSLLMWPVNSHIREPHKFSN